MRSKRVKVEVWHNIMWSAYKAKVFTELERAAQKEKIDVHVYQIAETEANRMSLSNINKVAHQYTHSLLFKGALDKVPLWKRVKKISDHALRSDADIVVIAGYEKPEYWLHLLINKLRRKKTAVFCDSTAYDRPQTLLKSTVKTWFFRSCDHVFCYGQRAKEYVMSFGVPAERIAFRCQAAALPEGYDVSNIQAIRALARQSAPPGPRLLYVGRLSPEKYLNVLIGAMAKYVQKSPLAHLVIVGGGPEESALKNMVAQLGLNASVSFLGPKSGNALFQEYSAASALVLPSYSEPWGLVVNEALSYGCPVIVSNRCGCVPELVHEGKSGYAYDCTDENALVSTLVKAECAFADVATVTQNCLGVISSFTPINAARDIVTGLKRL